MKQDVIKEFAEFLYRHDKLDVYIVNIKATGNVIVGTSLMRTGFCWNSTPQGTAYWSEVDDKWQDYCKGAGHG